MLWPLSKLPLFSLPCLSSTSKLCIQYRSMVDFRQISKHSCTGGTLHWADIMQTWQLLILLSWMFQTIKKIVSHFVSRVSIERNPCYDPIVKCCTRNVYNVPILLVTQKSTKNKNKVYTTTHIYTQISVSDTHSSRDRNTHTQDQTNTQTDKPVHPYPHPEPPSFQRYAYTHMHTSSLSDLYNKLMFIFSFIVHCFPIIKNGQTTHKRKIQHEYNKECLSRGRFNANNSLSNLP